ncbi:MAG: 16S rRNA (cytosine(967)-C(5))-methyltransferase RsmB [Clostridia bacterium]|nr:16S rRNA (cytosine(967)-C(5))-methyltransferase RsmB [Clostridia bacterium]
MIQINPREIAAEAMVEIMEEGAYNNMALRRLLRQNGAMPQKDRALVTEIVNGTLRNLYYIDHVLNQFSKTKTEKLKPWILAVLRTAVYQMYFMKIPDSAACNEAVKLIEERGLTPLKGFVNGVLRTVGREKGSIVMPKVGTAEFLNVQYSHPLWLIKMWIAYFGFEETEKLCQANNCPPDVSIRINTLKTEKALLKKELENIGAVVTEGSIAPFALHLKKTADIGGLKAFTEGLFHVQDESSQLAVEILNPQKGEAILDLCAAPGGKSFTIAQKMENSGKLVCGDIYEHKMELIAEGAERLGITIIEPRQQDATQWREKYADAFDRVLVDAPCSGLGLMGKKPDIRLKKNGDEIDRLVPIQREILENGAKYVKQGGILVYSTCTLCKKENEKNVEWFLKNHPDFTAENITEFLPKELWQETADKGYITLLPHRSNTDGFFIAKMKRKG